MFRIGFNKFDNINVKIENIDTDCTFTKRMGLEEKSPNVYSLLAYILNDTMNMVSINYSSYNEPCRTMITGQNELSLNCQE